MSGIGIFFTLTLILVLFSGMLITYGVGNPTITNQLTGPINCDINNFPPEKCQFTPYNPPNTVNATVTSTSQATPFPQCLLFIPSCFNGAISTITNTGLAIWNLVLQVGYGLAWFAFTVYVLFNKIMQSIFLVYGISQIMSTDFGLFGLQYFYLTFLIFYIVYGMTLIKPAGGGG